MKREAMFMAACIMAIASCWAQEMKYTVKGTCPADVSKVYLIDKLTHSKLDSAKVKHHQFAFEGVQQKDALLGVMKAGGDWLILFFNDGAPVTVDLEKNTLQGSSLNEKLTDFDLECQRNMEVMEALNEEYKALSSQEREARRLEMQQRANQAMEKLYGCYFKILNENRDNVLPAAFANTMFDLFDEHFLQEAFDAEKYVYARHPYAVSVKKQHDAYVAMEKAREQARGAIIGLPFRDFDEPDMNGELRKLSEYVGRGEWVLVDFWASWCGPCRAEMPNVVAAYQKYHDRGFNIVGVSFDQNKDAWLKAIVDLKMPWVHLSDLKGWGNKAVDIYDIHSIPASLLINPEGIIVARDLRGPELGAKLREIFGE